MQQASNVLLPFAPKFTLLDKTSKEARSGCLP